MGFLDRFKKKPNDSNGASGDGPPLEPPTAEPTEATGTTEPDAWDGSAVDWSAAGVTPETVDLAAELAGSPDFGVDPSGEDGYRWTVALYDDVRGLVGDPAIEALPAWLTSLDDIERADHLDREIIEVDGSVDRDGLAVRIIARLAETADPTYWDDDPG